MSQIAQKGVRLEEFTRGNTSATDSGRRKQALVIYL